MNQRSIKDDEKDILPAIIIKTRTTSFALARPRQLAVDQPKPDFSDGHELLSTLVGTTAR